MEPEYDDNEEFESGAHFSPELVFSLPVIVNGIKTEVSFICCNKGEPGEYISVNLVRNGSCVNSFTMNYAANTRKWIFTEEYIPKELKIRQEEFSKEILTKTSGYFSA